MVALQALGAYAEKAYKIDNSFHVELDIKKWTTEEEIDHRAKKCFDVAIF